MNGNERDLRNEKDGMTQAHESQPCPEEVNVASREQSNCMSPSREELTITLSLHFDILFDLLERCNQNIFGSCSDTYNIRPDPIDHLFPSLGLIEGSPRLVYDRCGLHCTQLTQSLC